MQRAEGLLAEARTWEKERERLEAEIREHRESAQRYAATMTELQRRRAEVEQLEHEHAALMKDLRHNLREHARAETAALQLKARRDELEAEVQRQHDLAVDLESRLARVEPHRAELETLSTELARVREQLEADRSELREVSQQLRQARVMLTEQIPELTISAPEAGDPKRWADLREPVFAGDEFDADAKPHADEAEALETFATALHEAGLYYPRRALEAFHTSLKISDVASLTVLAGVSGTGKSLLPRLYARHFGMYELNVAVQPRWDSPQDLFGYYNYLEQRYRATDLARALWQFEGYNRGDWAGDDDDYSEGLLLVLLDEMNLARVEYYFSEWLSRLEMRGFDPIEDEAQRRQVEIALDVGTREDGPRLYPDYNVFFVGTMNEDETTQTLSDKVLDRANVLRFGSPQTFTAAAGKRTLALHLKREDRDVSRQVRLTLPVVPAQSVPLALEVAVQPASGHPSLRVEAADGSAALGRRPARVRWQDMASAEPRDDEPETVGFVDPVPTPGEPCFLPEIHAQLSHLASTRVTRPAIENLRTILGSSPGAVPSDGFPPDSYFDWAPVQPGIAALARYAQRRERTPQNQPAHMALRRLYVEVPEFYESWIVDKAAAHATPLNQWLQDLGCCVHRVAPLRRALEVIEHYCRDVLEQALDTAQLAPDTRRFHDWATSPRPPRRTAVRRVFEDAHLHDWFWATARLFRFRDAATELAGEHLGSIVVALITMVLPAFGLQRDATRREAVLTVLFLLRLRERNERFLLPDDPSTQTLMTLLARHNDLRARQGLEAFGQPLHEIVTDFLARRFQSSDLPRLRDALATDA